jgi:predicted metal-dependent HD superfamily phosphohydrolase
VNGQYQDHEARSADIFRQFNQQYKLYSPEDEEQIVDIILATKVSYTNPIKIEHKIIKDADLDNL